MARFKEQMDESFQNLPVIARMREYMEQQLKAVEGDDPDGSKAQRIRERMSRHFTMMESTLSAEGGRPRGRLGGKIETGPELFHDIAAASKIRAQAAADKDALQAMMERVAANKVGYDKP